MKEEGADTRFGWHQLKALLWRQYILKKRDWCNSLVELLSPVLLLLLLVWAFSKADRTHVEQGIYADETAKLLAQLVQQWQDYPDFNLTACLDAASALGAAGGTNSSFGVADPAMLGDPGYSQQATTSIWQQFASNPSALTSGLAAGLASGVLSSGNLSDWLSSPGTASLDALRQQLDTLQACIDSLRDFESPTNVTSGFLEHLTNLNGPLPIPSMDEFILLHKAVAHLANSDPRMMDVIRGARREFGWNMLGNLLDMGKLAFAPDTPEVRKLAHWMVHNHEYFEDTFHGIFETEAAAEQFALTASPRLWALVVFEDGPGAAGVSYTIRMNFTVLPGTMVKLAKWNHGVNEEYHYYITSGFLSIQSAIDNYALGLSSSAEAMQVLPEGNSSAPSAAGPANVTGWSLWTVPFPTAAYDHNEFYDAGGQLLGLVLCMCQVYALAMMVRGMVAEKETRARETMLIMGLKPWVLTTAWVTTYALTFAFISAAITLLCCLSFFPTTSPTLLFTFLLVFAATEVAFAVMLAAVFNRAKIAAIMGPLMHFAALMPRFMFFRTEEAQAVGAKMVASVLSPTAFTFGVDLLARYEGADQGMQWRDVWADEYAVGAVMCIMAADMTLYFLLAWYLQQVLPSAHGHSEHPLFLFTPAYWRNKFGVKFLLPSWLYCLLPGASSRDKGVKYIALMDSDEAQHDLDGLVEQFGRDGDAPAVHVSGLSKAYGSYLAVNGVSFEMQYDRVTALLGHNGAGKSSLVGVMTGLLPPSAGRVMVAGFDVVSDVQQVRRRLGVCPQQNVLFEKMTVWEHLMLYAAIKGMPGGAWSKGAVDEGMSMMEGLGLTDKKDTAAGALSGGMKRKLQVALALLAGSEVVFLDEPTSGMDPVSRRALWQLLRSYRTGRAMLLTTHYMDEADLLSDDIVILSQGQVCAIGTAMKLKERYGNGYSLNLSVDLNGPVDRVMLHDVITEAVPGSRLCRSNAAELVYLLPYGDTQRFPQLMNKLDKEGAGLGVCHYGLSMPTLEDVFLTVTSHNDEEDKAATGHADVSRTRQNAAGSRGGYVLSRGTVAHSLRCFRQMLSKRAIGMRRDKKGAVFTLLLPVVAICLVLLVLKVDINPTSPSMKLTMEHLAEGSGALWVSNTPPAVVGCIDRAWGSCGDRLSMTQVDANGSYAMSVKLLQDITDGRPPRYGALVFNDSTILDMAIEVDADANVTVDVQPGVVHRAIDTLDQVGKQYGISAARVASRLLHRLADYPPLTLMHNSSSWHALPALLADMHSTFSKSHSANGTGVSINVVSHPLPLTESESTKLDLMLSLVAALFILVPFCYLSGSYAISPVAERAAGAHHMQLLSGCPVSMYWLGSYCVDMMTHSAIALLTMLILWAYGDENTTGSFPQAFGTFLLLWMYGFAVVPLAYCYSFAFSSPSVAQIAVAAVNFLTGFVLVNANYIMKALPKARHLQKILVHFARMFPSFLLGEGLVEVSKYKACLQLMALNPDSGFMHGACAGGAWHLFQWKILGRSLIFLAAGGALLFAQVVLMDTMMHRQGVEGSLLFRIKAWVSKIASKLRRKARGLCVEEHDVELMPADAHVVQHKLSHASANGMAEGSDVAVITVETEASAAPLPADQRELACDPEVAAEQSRVDSGAALQDSICLKHLRKVYPTHPPKVAVHDLCLGIRAGERFGFLGPNGAGKSSTLSILCGQQLPSGGDVFVGGASILQQQAGAGGQLGYCPQVDPLLDLLTAVEQLAFYARVKGVPESHVKSEVIDVIRRVGITPETACRPCGQYSGGNKRKLSLAIALIGRPVALLLDEPSSGMDPGARRDMWRAILAATRPTGNPVGPAAGPPITVVLTTHCMEECDALCGRVGIMKGGSLHCLGAPQRLKSLYGGGYLLEVQFDEGGRARGGPHGGTGPQLIGWVLTEFPGAQTEEQQCGSVKFRLPKEGVSLGGVFTKLEAVKEGMGVRAYSISQPTLEQVFVSVVGNVRGLMASD